MRICRSKLRNLALLLAIGMGIVACTTPSERTLQKLRVSVAAQRESLSKVAGPYRIENSDASLELEGKPLDDLLNDFNGKPASDRRTTVKSTGTTGDLYYHTWFECFWGGHAAWFIDLLPKWSFIGYLQVGTIHSQWGGSNGFDFAVPVSGAFAGNAVLYVDNCLWQTPTYDLPVVGYINEDFAGHLVAKSTDSGAEFHFHVTSPNHITIYGSVAGVALWYNADSMDDLAVLGVDNLVGKKGELKFGTTGVCRDYALSVKAKNPRVLNVGLALDSEISVAWEAPKQCTDSN